MKMRSKLWLLAGLLLIVSLAYLVWDTNKIKVISESKVVHDAAADAMVAEQKSGQSLTGIHLYESAQNQQDWELQAEHAEGSKNVGAWNLEKVDIKFFSQEVAKYFVTGDRGSLQATSKNMEISGNVRTTTSNGHAFYSEKVIYEATSRQIRSPDFVRMKGPEQNSGGRMELTGFGFRADIASGKSYVTSRVHATKPSSTGDTYIIDSNSVEFINTSQTAVFRGHVKILVEDMELRAPVAKLLYGIDDSFQNIELSGGVHVVQGDKRSSSQNLAYDPTTRTAVLTGNPVVMDHEDEIRGEVIKILDGGRKVEVSKINALIKNENGTK